MNLKKIICIIAAGLNLGLCMSSNIMAHPENEDSPVSETVCDSPCNEDKIPFSRSQLQKKEIPTQRPSLSKVPNVLPLRNSNDILPPKPPACGEDKQLLRLKIKKKPSDLFFENLYCLKCKMFIGKEEKCPNCNCSDKISWQGIINSLDCCPFCEKRDMFYKFNYGNYRGYACRECKRVVKLKIQECNNGEIIEVFQNLKLTHDMLQLIFEINNVLSKEKKTKRIEEWKKGNTETSYYPHPLCHDN